MSVRRRRPRARRRAMSEGSWGGRTSLPRRQIYAILQDFSTEAPLAVRTSARAGLLLGELGRAPLQLVLPLEAVGRRRRVAQERERGEDDSRGRDERGNEERGGHTRTSAPSAR